MASIILRNSTDMTAVPQSGFANLIASTIDSYKWSTSNSNGFNITALSGTDNITVDGGSGLPLTGTIAGLFAVNATSGLIAYAVTDLSVPLTSLVDANTSVSSEKYWETILAGTTEFTNEQSAIFTLSGDFILVSNAQALSGAADTFDLLLDDSCLLIGDSFNVATGGTLTGGNDKFILRNVTSIAYTLAGDVQTHAGTVNGGADTMTLNAAFGDGTIISGDVLVSDGILNGGNDKLTLNMTGDFAADTIVFAGDAQLAQRQVTGGDDAMVLRLDQLTGVGFLMEMSGDVHTAATVNSVVTGGDDTMTITDVNVFKVAGDAISQSAGFITGGDDRITLNSKQGTTIAGDVFDFTGGTLTPGADIIRGGSGGDTIFGESTTANFPQTAGTTVNAGGNDVIDGRDGDDTLLGQVGNDILTGGRGDDVINGGSGSDTASFGTLNIGVYVDLLGITGSTAAIGLAEAIGQGFDDLLLVENISGSSRGDTLKGDAAANVFSGLDGDDTLNTRSGNDTLVGGNGKDVLVGGSGTDTYDFNAATELSADSSLTDIIIGFASGDRIDISDIVTGKANLASPFTFQTAALTGAGQVTFTQTANTTIISGSTDGDAAAEFTILVRGLVNLTASDFIL